MATTIYAVANENWDATNGWSTSSGGSGTITNPQTTDYDCVLNGKIVAMGANITSITVNSITDPGKAGQLTVAINTIGNCSINATTITCGTVFGLIKTTGAGTNQLTINVTNFTGGVDLQAAGMYIVGGCPVTINVAGTLSGGTGGSAQAVYMDGGGTLTIEGGTVQAGGGIDAVAIRNDWGTLNVNNANLLLNFAYPGMPMFATGGQVINYNPGASNYIQIGSTKYPAQVGDVMRGDRIESGVIVVGDANYAPAMRGDRIRNGTIVYQTKIYITDDQEGYEPEYVGEYIYIGDSNGKAAYMKEGDIALYIQWVDDHWVINNGTEPSENPNYYYADGLEDSSFLPHGSFAGSLFAGFLYS